ncbi:unnamed protein product [Rangifer tarandus platyrhynchus]|uniref:Uncharacterized protein n=1 Tax=Rangifer tarandus platyrhynchus TaxID=3082113 RepID=A0ABN8XVL6_RANTA|nr:unnamed protein product [Rangifer tarandus platyrhynchus]
MTRGQAVAATVKVTFKITAHPFICSRQRKSRTPVVLAENGESVDQMGQEDRIQRVNKAPPDLAQMHPGQCHCARAGSCQGWGGGVGGAVTSRTNRKRKSPPPRAGGPSLTPAVGGEGGASCAAAEGAGPGAWRRGLVLSVPRPPLPPRFLTCRGPVAAGAADRRPPPRHPEPPSAVPGRRAGKAGRTAEPSRP